MIEIRQTETGRELWIDGKGIMTSYEPDIVPMREFCEKAYGNVLVTGLGLGEILKLLSQNSKVTGVTVIELSEEVIDAYLGLCETPPFVKIVKGDAENPIEGKFDCAYIDHWQEMEDFSPEYMANVRKKVKYADSRIEAMGRISKAWREAHLKAIKEKQCRQQLSSP